jgi:hypothetical protein
MIDHRSIEMRLVQVLMGIAVVAVLGVLAILPYRLYERDIHRAKVEAHRLSAIVRTALSEAVRHGGDTTSLVDRLQGIGDLEIRLVKLQPGEVHPAAATGKGSSRLSGTDLTYVAAPIRDRDDGRWLAEMYFDLSPMKRESIRLIIDLVLAVVIGSAIFSVIVFLLVRRSLVVPLRELTEIIERRYPDEGAVGMPEFKTLEMQELVTAVERACSAHTPQA